MKKIQFYVVLFFIGIANPILAQLQIGDPGVSFDQNKFDSNYPQMKIWQTAGVRGGIPFIKKLKIKVTLTSGANSAAISQAISKVASMGGGTILLKNGIYSIDKQVDMKSGVTIIGESRNGVKCMIDKDINANNAGLNEDIKGTAWDDGNGAFKFGKGVHNSGIYRLTIEGGWGTPKYKWNIGDSNLNFELPDNENISVWFIEATDCWLDDVTILNSGDFPLRCIGTHITLRNLDVDGVFNKNGGCHGYFFLLQGAKYNLITKCKITHIRHISLQGDGVEYNVLYDNDFRQEISFHTGDDGNNLIENNRITIPADMPGKEDKKPNYFAIMGPWASFHKISSHFNYVLKNKCVELNPGHDGATPWSDDSIIYAGPKFVKPEDPLTNFTALPMEKYPKYGTLYPIILTK